MEKLRANFAMSGFSGEILDKIINAFHVKAYKKGDYFVEAGKTSLYLGFIESGMFHYYVMKDGDKRTSYVSIENTFIASLMSFISETPSKESVRAMVDSEVSVISRKDLKIKMPSSMK